MLLGIQKYTIESAKLEGRGAGEAEFYFGLKLQGTPPSV